MKSDTFGAVHSIYIGGMVDGPGIRTVVFLAGCSLRCKYCHNPDTWHRIRGNKKTVQEIIDEVKKYSSYYKFSGGGITVSGGEPADQPFFLRELLRTCRSEGIHTTLDTSGFPTEGDAEDILPYVDLLMLDFKAFDPETYKKITGITRDRMINTLSVAEAQNVPTWIRYVLVPGLTDDYFDLHKTAAFLKLYGCIRKVDILPFHKHGEHKWKELGLDYELHDTQPPTPEQVAEAQGIFA